MLISAVADLYQQLFELNPRPMWLFDRQTLAFLLVNDAACRHYGWTRDEFLAMTLLDIRAPEELPALRTAVARARTETELPTVARHVTKAGAAIDVHLDIARVELEGRAVSLVVVTDITGVRETERLHRLMVEHSADGICVTEIDGVVRYMSPGAERLLGLASGALVGKHAGGIAHPGDLAKVTAWPPGGTREHLTRARHADGTWRWIAWTTTNLTLDPSIRGYVTNFRDVTARIAAEHALQEAHHRLEFLLSATSAVTYSARPTLSFDTTFISANARDVLGWDAEHFVGTFRIDHVHPADRDAVDVGRVRLLETGAYSFEYRFAHGDGSYRWVLDSARVVRDDAGVPLEIVGYMIDVTERKAMEESLRRSEANFRTLIERSPTVILVHCDGIIAYVNPAGVALLAYDSADELIGHHVLDTIHPEDRGMVRASMARTMQQGRTMTETVRIRRRDGSYVWIDGEAIRLAFDGKPANVVIGRDVTERSEMFTRMAVADRLRSVGTLAAGVAHEINNPLAFIVSNLALLADELPLLFGEDTRHLARLDRAGIEDLLRDAREGAARVSAIVRDLRALARPDDATTTTVDVAKVLASSIRMASNELRHRASVVEHFEPAPSVQGNESRLGQVFLNLLVNAAQAIPEGRVDDNEVRVRLAAAADGRHTIVEIEDTGAGIPALVLGRIFDPFFTTKPAGVGVGLGLAISHQIVRSMAGEISVTSTPGHGARFRIVFPAATAQIAPARVPSVVTAGAAARVLMIDDEAAVGRSTRALLAPDYDITPVTRAAEGLALLAADARFDAILCDLMMPEMSGIEFYQQLSRTAPAYLNRVVFLTGGAFTERARGFLATVSQPHLEKPLREQDLRRAIEEVRAVAASP